MPDRPSLVELSPLIEVVHHACKCEDYDEAHKIRQKRIHMQNKRYITHNLGAWETQLEIMQEFFPQGDTSREPCVSSPHYKSWILNAIGLCLCCTGRGDRAEGFYQRALGINIDSRTWDNASVDYRNLSDLYSLRGELEQSAQAADEALKLARRAKNKQQESDSLAYQAWALHLLGQVADASRAFREAEALQRVITSSNQYLCSIRGIQHADHLRRAEDVDYARKVTEANMRKCEEYSSPDGVSQCHRVLGDLYTDAGQVDYATEHYRQAVAVARSISMKLVLIEALLSRGRWEARRLQDPEAAFSDLKEALDYARAGGYRIYEADIRVALAWAYLAAKNEKSAQEEATYALQMSEEMSYHWGKVDSEEVLAEIDKVIPHSSK
jgi:tetratricopeptide (TPR) repeat protein